MLFNGYGAGRMELSGSRQALIMLARMNQKCPQYSISGNSPKEISSLVSPGNEKKERVLQRWAHEESEEDIYPTGLARDGYHRLM